MFFTALFPSEKSTLLVYAKWEDGDINSCQLHIFANFNDANAFTSQVDSSRIEIFTKTLSDMRHSEHKSHSFYGPIASTFTHQMMEFCKYPADVFIKDEPTLCGFLGPTHEALPDAAIMWYTPQTGQHVSVVYSQEQAKELIETLTWLEYKQKERLLRSAERWHFLGTGKDAEKIPSPVSELICTMSMAAKYRQQMRRSMH